MQQSNTDQHTSTNAYTQTNASEPDLTATKAHSARGCWMTWWLWRGARTRSLPELGRENPQRPWYCVLRRGRVGRRQVFQQPHTTAGWSSPVARQAHNLKVTGSNPVPATISSPSTQKVGGLSASRTRRPDNPWKQEGAMQKLGRFTQPVFAPL